MANRTNFIVTFGQQDKARRDGWVLLTNVRDVEQAKAFADREFAGHYSMLYREDDFHEGYFPKGCLGEHNLRAWHDYLS